MLVLYIFSFYIAAPDKGAIGALLAGLQLTGPTGYVEELTAVDGGQINRKVFMNGELKKDVTAPVGKEFDGKSWDGRAAKVSPTLCIEIVNLPLPYRWQVGGI